MGDNGHVSFMAYKFEQFCGDTFEYPRYSSSFILTQNILRYVQDAYIRTMLTISRGKVTQNQKINMTEFNRDLFKIIMTTY